MRILVVEDERLLADAVATGLRRHALAVDVAYDGTAALDRAAVNDYDVVVLDRDLPAMSGDAVCRKLIGTVTVVLPSVLGGAESRSELSSAAWVFGGR